MWTSLPIALVAILLLSDPASARRNRSVTVESDHAITISTTSSDSGSSGILEENSNGEVQAVVTTVVRTLTVIPMPVGTVSGVFYPGLSTGTGSGYARPTGHHHGNGTGNKTHSSLASSTAANGTILHSTSSSIPFFSLQTTASLAPPNISTSIIAPPRTSLPIPSIFTSSIIPPTILSTLIPTASITIPSSSSIVPIASSTELTQSSTSTISTAAAATASTTIPFLRGVNLGGWLVLEKWMDSDAFTGAFANAADQYTFDSIPGAAAALEEHWSTFFAEDDIRTIAATGIDALRIPIGYWAYDNADTPYITGADAYLEKAIGWARTYGMKVWVDCHGSPGSQNGFDNSGHAGSVDWQQTANLERSISVLKTMASKYGAEEYADVVVGLEMTNEPISYGNNVFSVTQSWAQEAYAAVKAEVANPNLVIVMHDAFQGPLAWTSIAGGLADGGIKTFGVDTHLYQLYTDTENTYTQAQHITEACGWAANLASANEVMPTYVGEWSAATNICVNPDGTTTSGTSCSVSGCQCQSADFSDWNDAMIEQVRKYVEAQLDVFESSSSGYFIWAAKGPGGWGFLNGIGNGAIPNPVTSRKYSGQCGSKRREVRGTLGLAGEAF